MTLSQFRQHFEALLAKRKRNWEGNRLGEACLYALHSGGKRVRPVVTYAVAEALGNGANVDEAALAVEYFHTSSLIADDLPCMDDDRERRGKPSLHVRFDESTALLASYALITAAFEQIFHASEMLADPKRGLLALELASVASGFTGATGGQHLDITTKEVDGPLLNEILLKKTVTLFEVAFGLGFLFGGGEICQLSKIKKAAYHFGMAFQIADDIADWGQDSGRVINYARHFGLEKAAKDLEMQLDQFSMTMEAMKIYAPAFRDLRERIAYLATGAPS